MKKAKIVIGVTYNKKEDFECLLQSITQDTESYTSSKNNLTVWVDDVLEQKRRK